MKVSLPHEAHFAKEGSLAGSSMGIRHPLAVTKKSIVVGIAHAIKRLFFLSTCFMSGGLWTEDGAFLVWSSSIRCENEKRKKSV